MPKRPPRQWWRHCVAGVSASGSAYDPAKVCGALWYHKISPMRRVAIVRRSEHHSPNPGTHTKGRPLMQRQSVLNVVHSTTSNAALEARTHNLPAAGDAFEALGQTTVAIGSKVRGWEHAFGTAAGPILRHRKRKATKKQLAALAKARRARKKAGHHGRITTKKAAHTGHRKRRTHKQVLATKKLVRLNKARARARHAGDAKGRKKHHRKHR